MHLFSALVALALPFASLAATTPAERFNNYHTKSLVSSPVKLKDSSYRSLTSIPRDYSVAVLLTALETRFGCKLCIEFHPEWDLLARSWINGDREGKSRLIFGTLDFSDGREVFKSLGLQTAPLLLVFPPTIGPHAASSAEPRRFDFSTGPHTAEGIHAFISKALPGRPHPAVQRPTNWIRLFVTVTTVVGSATASLLAWPYFYPLISNRRVWSAVSLISILLFVSGTMFNHIRKVPYVAASPKGGPIYIASGFQNQYGMETQIVALLYGLLSFVTIGLATKVPKIKHPKAQQVAVIGYSVALLGIYSLLLTVFRIKNGGYPFSLPPFM